MNSMENERKSLVEKYYLKFKRFFDEWADNTSAIIPEDARYPGDIEYLMLLYAGQVYRTTSENTTGHIDPLNLLMQQPDEDLRRLLLAVCNYIETKHIIESVHEIVHTSRIDNGELKAICAFELEDVLMFRDRIDVALWAVRMLGWPFMVEKEDPELSMAFGLAGQKAAALDDALLSYPEMTLEAMQIFNGWRRMIITPLREGYTEWWLEDAEAASARFKGSGADQKGTITPEYLEEAVNVTYTLEEILATVNEMMQSSPCEAPMDKVLSPADGGSIPARTYTFVFDIAGSTITVKASIHMAPLALHLVFTDNATAPSQCPQMLCGAQIIVESPRGEALFRGCLNATGAITIRDSSQLPWARLHINGADGRNILSVSLSSDDTPEP